LFSTFSSPRSTEQLPSFQDVLAALEEEIGEANEKLELADEKIRESRDQQEIARFIEERNKSMAFLEHLHRELVDLHSQCQEGSWEEKYNGRSN